MKYPHLQDSCYTLADIPNGKRGIERNLPANIELGGEPGYTAELNCWPLTLTRTCCFSARMPHLACPSSDTVMQGSLVQTRELSKPHSSDPQHISLLISSREQRRRPRLTHSASASTKVAANCCTNGCTTGSINGITAGVHNQCHWACSFCVHGCAAWA